MDSARAKFKNALLASSTIEDAPPISEASISQFCDEVEAVLEKNTPQNVQVLPVAACTPLFEPTKIGQTCKEFIINTIAPAKDRAVALGEYLVSRSKHIVVGQNRGREKAIRNRLDLVGIISDVLHTAKHHSSYPKLPHHLHPYIVELVGLAASCLSQEVTPSKQKLIRMIQFWVANDLVEFPLHTRPIQDRIDNEFRLAHVAQNRVDALPEWFGDRNAAWSDLPASYALPAMIHSQQRSNLDRIKARHFSQRQISQKVTDLLDDYLKNIDLVHRPTGDTAFNDGGQNRASMDAIGHVVLKDRMISNGYGWSESVCKEVAEKGIVECDVVELDQDQEQEERSPANMNVDARMNDRYDSDSSRSRGRRYSSSNSEYEGSRDRRDRRSRSNRSRSPSSPRRRTGRSSSRRYDERSRERGRGSRYGDREDDGAHYEPSRNYGTFDPRQPVVPPPHPFPNQNVGHEQSYGPPPAPAPQNPHAAVPPFVPQQPQFPGQFPMPFMPPNFPGPPFAGMPGPPNFGAFPNAYPPMGGASFPNQFGNSATFGQNNGHLGQHSGHLGQNNGQHAPAQGFGGMNRGGFQGNNYNAGNGYTRYNQQGRGRGGRWN